MNPFGTDGIRGDAATCPYLQPLFLAKLGYALAIWAGLRTKTAPRFIFARDTRASGAAISAHLAASIMRHGGLCFDAGILTTPALQFLVTYEKQSYDYAIMITASHNKASDNGVKISGPAGKISNADEAFIATLLADAPLPITVTTYTPATPTPHHHAQRYSDYIRTAFPGDMLRGVRIVVDCAHGAASRSAPALIASYGAKVHALHTETDGKNINASCGSTAPQRLQAAVKDYQATYGIAFDGDGDRVCMVNARGALLWGEEMLALLSTLPAFAREPAIVGSPLMNSGLDTWLQERNKKLIRAGIGDRVITRTLEEKKLSLGGEPCGHLIIRPHLPTADGLFAALATLQALLQKTQPLDLPLQRVPQETIALPARRVKNLTEEPFASIIRAGDQKLFPGRSFIRYSGTEPVIRLMTEHPDAAVAREVLETLACSLAPYLND